MIVKEAYKRGIIFTEMVCDGDNNTVETLNEEKIYQNISLDIHIRKHLCLSHILRRLMNDLMKICNRKCEPVEYKKIDRKTY